MSARSTEPGTCPFCREAVEWDAARCPHCEEDLVLGRTGGSSPGPSPAQPLEPRPAAPDKLSSSGHHRRAIASASAAGFGAGLFLVGAGERVLGGLLPDLAAAPPPLRFLELTVAAIFLLELARYLRPRS